MLQVALYVDALMPVEEALADMEKSEPIYLYSKDVLFNILLHASVKNKEWEYRKGFTFVCNLINNVIDRHLANVSQDFIKLFRTKREFDHDDQIYIIKTVNEILNRSLSFNCHFAFSTIPADGYIWVTKGMVA